jgi:hypothetical protein
VPAYTVNEDPVSREATTLAERTDFIDFHASALSDLAEVLRLANRPKEARAALEDATRLYEEKGNVMAAQHARGALAELQVAT